MSHYIERWCSKHGDYSDDVDNIAGCTECPDPFQLIAEALPVMEWVATGRCVFCSGKIKSEDSCVHARARAWIAKHGKESL